MKPFYASKTFWLNMATLPATALLTPIIGAEWALKIGVAVNTAGNLVLRLWFTDKAVTAPFKIEAPDPAP